MDTMIGVDLAKSVFQLHGATMTGVVLFRKKLTRPQFEKFMSEHDPAVVVMESCGGSHFWARQMKELGHEVKLIAPQYVRPFVKRQRMMQRMPRQSLTRHSAPKCGLSNPSPRLNRQRQFCFAQGIGWSIIEPNW